MVGLIAGLLSIPGQSPVGVCFVARPGLFGSLVLQEKDVLLELSLLHKEFSVDLGEMGGTSDMLGICETRMSRFLRATVLLLCSGLTREALLLTGLRNSLLYLLLE